MNDQAFLVLLALTVLATKHMIIDFCTQTLWQIRNKRIYGHPGGLVHAAGHAAGTCLAFFVIPPTVGVAIAIVVGEFFVHYHIDWLKEQIGVRLELRPDQWLYWVAFGIDQWLHQLTYLGIALVLILN